MIELKKYRGNKLLFVDEEFDTLVNIIKQENKADTLEFINRDGSKQ